jgi:hypothetical protein
MNYLIDGEADWLEGINAEGLPQKCPHLWPYDGLVSMLSRTVYGDPHPVSGLQLQNVMPVAWSVVQTCEQEQPGFDVEVPPPPLDLAALELVSKMEPLDVSGPRPRYRTRFPSFCIAKK